MRAFMNLTLGALLAVGLGATPVDAQVDDYQEQNRQPAQQDQPMQQDRQTNDQERMQDRQMNQAAKQNRQGQQATKRDAQVADVISNRLARSGSLAGTQIVVAVQGSTAMLTGSVGSQQEKQRAEQIALSTSGIRNVENNLDVDAAGVRERRDVDISDEELARKIAEKLQEEVFTLAEVEENWLYGWQVEGSYWGFDVDVDDGRVSLEGEVPMYQDITSAVQVTRNVAGVNSVDAGDLDVEGWNDGYWDYDPYGYYPYYDYYGYDYGYYEPFGFDYWDYSYWY